MVRYLRVKTFRKFIVRALALPGYGGAVANIVLYDPEKEKERAFEDSITRMRKRLAAHGAPVGDNPFRHGHRLAVR